MPYLIDGHNLIGQLPTISLAVCVVRRSRYCRRIRHAKTCPQLTLTRPPQTTATASSR